MPHDALEREDFSAYYAFSPAALAVREAVRLSAVRSIDLPEPILDVGCGDGLFARLAHPSKQIWGIDINPTEVKRAQATDSYATLICGDVCRVDLPSQFFGGAIANCSLEHVPDLTSALANIRHSLRPGAPFVLIVPTPEWTRSLGLAKLLASVGMRGAANAYGDALDRVFNHVHLHDEHWWADRLRDASFEVVDTKYIVSQAANYLFELLLPPSAIGYLVKKLTGRWIAAPALRAPTSRLAWSVVDFLHRSLPDADAQQFAAEYIIVGRAVD